MEEVFARDLCAKYSFFAENSARRLWNVIFMDKGFKTSTRSIILKAKSEERYMNPAACCL